MAVNQYARKIAVVFFYLSLALWQHGCSTGGETPEAGEELSSTDEDAAEANGEGDANGNPGNEGDDSNLGNLAQNAELGEGATEATPAAEPAVAAAAPAPNLEMDAASVMTPADAAARVVRFITIDQTPVYDHPQAGANTVATMLHGDPVVVSLQGEWAQISEGRYLMNSALSEALIPRVKTPTGWNTQASNP